MAHSNQRNCNSDNRLPQLAQAAQTILNINDLGNLWTAVTSTFNDLLKPDGLAVCYYRPDRVGQIELHGHNVPDAFLKRIASRPILWQKQQIITKPSSTAELISPIDHLLQQEGLHTMAIFPLSQNAQWLGGIALFWQTAVSLTPDQTAVGELLTRLVTHNIQNIRLFAAQKRALQREQQLNEFSRTLNELQDLPTILSYVAGIAAQLTSANTSKLGLIINDQVMMFYPYNIPTTTTLRPLMRGHGLPWEIVETGQPIQLNRYPDHPQAQTEMVKLGVTAFLGVPILVRDDVCLGTINLFKTAVGDRFHQRDLELVESLARQAGVSIQNSRLYTEFEQRTSALASALIRQEELDHLKNLFVQNMSHELRTPLGIIYGHAEMLASGALGSLENSQKESIAIIARRAQMLTYLVNDLTALMAAETQEMRRELIDLAALIQDLVADYGLQAKEAGLYMKTILPERVPQVNGNLTNLRRVFDNLVTNALKFTPPGGTITIRLWVETKRIQIEVSDTGIGIPAEQLGRIFERFYQVDSHAEYHHKGTGLGLALVKEIIVAHHGEVTVSSLTGEGTTFLISLPLAGKR